MGEKWLSQMTYKVLKIVVSVSECLFFNSRPSPLRSTLASCFEDCAKPGTSRAQTSLSREPAYGTSLLNSDYRSNKCSRLLILSISGHGY